MTNDELRQLVESNTRTAQAMLDSMAEARLEREELRSGMQRMENLIARLDDTVERLTTPQEGVINLLSSLDDDRPTVLRKLNTLENKLDRLLESRNEE
jgi:chromosome segregation ATPase